MVWSGWGRAVEWGGGIYRACLPEVGEKVLDHAEGVVFFFFDYNGSGGDEW